MSQSTSSTSSLTSSEKIDPVAGKKFWSIGTLKYSAGSLAILFVILLLGDFAWSMRDRSVGEMSKWYLNSLKIPLFWFGILFSTFPAFIGLILGPIISVKSDLHRGKRGRRIPFLLVTTPIAAFGMIGLGLTPIITHWLHTTLSENHSVGVFLRHLLEGGAFGEKIISGMQNEVLMAVLCFALFWTCFEFATIAGQSVFGGLINDVVPKPMLGRFFGLFRAVSLIDGMIFNYWLIGKVPSTFHIFGWDFPLLGFTVIMIAIGIFYGVAFMWVCLKVKEGDYPPPPVHEYHPVTGAKANWLTSVRVYFVECFSNPYYVLVFIMMMTASLSFSPINIFAIPYAKSLQMDMSVYGKFLALTYFISLSLSFFLGWLADKIHPLRMAMITLFGYFLVTLWGHFNAHTVNNFLIAWVLHGVLSGCYFTGAATMGQRLFPHSKFAQFASAAGILMAIANMILGPALGQLIDATGKTYRYTFTVGCSLTVIALISAVIVYLRFLKLGGQQHYVAPGETEV